MIQSQSNLFITSSVDIIFDDEINEQIVELFDEIDDEMNDDQNVTQKNDLNDFDFTHMMNFDVWKFDDWIASWLNILIVEYLIDSIT